MKEENFKRIMKSDSDDSLKQLSNIKEFNIEPLDDLYQLRKDVSLFLTDNFLGKRIKNEQTGIDIIFTKQGIKKLVYGGGLNKLMILYQIEEIIRDASPIKIEELKNTNNSLKREAQFIYIFGSYVMINGKLQEFGFNTIYIEKDNVNIYFAKYNNLDDI